MSAPGWGQAWARPGPGPCPRIERQRDDASFRDTAAYVDVYLRAHGVQLGGHIGHTDDLFQKRCLRPARHCADRTPGTHHRIALARDGPVDHLKANQLPRGTAFLLLEQSAAADEVALLPADRPAEAGLDHGRRLVDVVAVETHGRFEAQRVACAKAAGNHVSRSS